TVMRFINSCVCIQDRVAHTVPVEGKIVACAPRQNMHVNVSHRLPGDFTVRLHKAQSARLQRLVHRASQLGHRCAHGSETLRRHLEQGCKMGLGDHQTMPFVGRMNVHECQSRLVPIELMTLRGSGSDLAENALRSGHSALYASSMRGHGATRLCPPYACCRHKFCLNLV